MGIKSPTADELFEALKHGDEAHRRWLREAIGRCVPR